MQERGLEYAHSSWLACVVLQLCAAAQAQVVEPNGLSVPIAPVTANELSIQSFFDMRMPPEPIDALREASAEPSTFSPRCGFQAELVLSQSQSPAGLAWYNVPSDPTAAPSALYQIVPETKDPGAMISSNQIRSDPNYAGGLIGFALTKFNGKPQYYSEASRNALCSKCSTPDHWKLMLAYPSHLEGTTYYLAWEDWEGANESSWPDDGDFNDKVFRLTGVRCAGGGEPCDTGQAGVCAQGLTGCSTGAAPGMCSPLEMPSREVCDGLDNDCNGVVDDDNPCTLGEICIRGRCTSSCGGVEFGCDKGQTCVQGQCVDEGCAGVMCEQGKVCQQGKCLAPCEGVVCPIGQVCRAGVCKDPCAAVSCKAGSVCQQGACLESCTCSGCPNGQACDTQSGSCVEPGCAGKMCPAGQACQQGACVDACKGAVCPRGAGCSAGQCAASQMIMRPSGAAGSGGVNVGVVNVAGTDGVAAGAMASEGSAGRLAPSVASRLRSHTGGCGCRAVAGGRSSEPGWIGLLVVVLWRGRRRR